MFDTIAKVAAPIIGGAIGAYGSIRSGEEQAKASRKYAKLQKQFAKYGIRWKVQDAIAAGLHPLAALGVQTAMPGAISVGVDRYEKAARSMGQGIASSIDRYAEREIARLSIDQEKARLKQLQLNNKLLQTEVDKSISGQPDSIGLNDIGVIQGQDYTTIHPDGVTHKGVQYVNKELPKSMTPGISAGIGPQEQYFITKDGYLALVPDEKFKEAIEDNFFLELPYNLGKFTKWVGRAFAHNWPNTKMAKKNRASLRRMRPKAPPGIEYRWDIKKGAFKRVKKNGTSQFYLNVRGYKY